MKGAIFAALVLAEYTLCMPRDLSSHKLDDVALSGSIVQQILAALESFRDDMQTGTEDIPVLDPLEVDYLVFELEKIGAEGDLTMSSLVVKNLSTFVVNDIKFSILSRRLTFDLSVPELYFIADKYDIDAFIEDQYIQGHGVGSLLAYDAKVRGTLRTRITWSGNIQIYDVQITILLGGLKSHIEGTAFVDVQAADINQIIEDLVPRYIKNNEREISDFLNPIVEQSVNDMLND